MSKFGNYLSQTFHNRCKMSSSFYKNFFPHYLLFYVPEINNVKTLDLGGCKVLTVKILISAEKPGRFTKLFLQSTAGKKVDCPLDINIRLKVSHAKL